MSLRHINDNVIFKIDLETVPAMAKWIGMWVCVRVNEFMSCSIKELSICQFPLESGFG